MNVREAAERFITALAADMRRDNTLKWYASILKPYVRQLGAQDVATVTSTVNRAYIVGLRTEVRRYRGASQKPEQPGPLSDATISAHVRGLKAFWSWCEAETIIDTNPMDRIRTHAPRKQVPRSASDADIRRLFAVTGQDWLGERDRAIIALLGDTGCRVGGLVGIRMKDLNLTTGTVILHEKRGTVRKVKFSVAPAALIAGYLRARPQDYNGELLFINKNRQAITEGGVYQMLKRLKKAAGISGHVNPHAFREYFARGYLEAGGDISTLARYLGNSPEVILSNYTLHMSQELSEVHDRFSPFARLVRKARPRTTRGDESE